MSAGRRQDACAPDAQVSNLRYGLRCDLRGGIAPAALAHGADGRHSEPVAGAARQAINRSARLGRGAVMCPTRCRRWIGALLNHITLGARHGIPTEIELPIMIPDR
jgi:hypothetical protein